MDQHLYVVFAQPKPGREDAFRSWYQQNNTDNLASIPGIRALRRYELMSSGSSAPPGMFMGIYGVEGDQLDLARSSWQARRDDREVALREGRTPFILKPPDLERSFSWWFSAITSEIGREPER